MPKSKYSFGLEGKRFTRTVIRSYSHAIVSGPKDTRHYWRCLCDCGTEHISDARSMFRGYVKSCGCYNRDPATKFTKHGHARSSGESPAWRSWHKMRGRIDNPKNEWFHRYGGRGIRYCLGFNEFSHFLKVLGPRPENQTVDRVDNNGHYSCGECSQCLSNNWPMNVRWATIDQQNANKVNSRFLSFNGKTQPLFLWARELGVPSWKLHSQLERGSLAEAFALFLTKESDPDLVRRRHRRQD